MGDHNRKEKSMNEIKKIVKSLSDELIEAFKEMPQARTDYTLRELVIGQHDTIEQQYAHVVLELRTAYTALQHVQISLERIDYEIEIFKEKAKENRLYEFKWRDKEIDKYETECAVIGKLREFNCLYKLWQSFPKKFTRAEVNANQKEYWEKRAVRQANQDLMANGRVSAGNQDFLRQIGKGITPKLCHVQEIEQKYIEGGNVKIMIGVPIEKNIPIEEQEDFKLPCISNLIVPNGVQYKVFTVHGRKVAAAYNEMVRQFLADGADYLLTVEDDTFPPPDALIRLMRHIADGKKVVGAWYPMRNGTGEGVPISIIDGKRGQLPADGELHEVYTIPMGCTLYAKEVFYRIEYPYFETTDCLSQDSFFSQKLRDTGYKLYCDTSIRCKHIDRETSKVYE